MRRLILAVAFVVAAASVGADKKPPYFEGKHPVFVVVCIVGGPCAGFYVDKKEAVRMHIPKCSATVTNFCYR